MGPRYSPHAVVAILGPELRFPPPWTATRDGLVAIGGDLSPERLVLAYRSGIFPWPIQGIEPMTWFSVDPRGIIPLEGLHVSRSLAKLMRREIYELSVNRAFPRVIAGCGESSERREGTWITPDMEAAYVELHQRGHAHSVEVWQGETLVGGLYGVAVGGLFAGESMFSRRPNASKLALVHLVERLRARQYLLLDTQTMTEHLRSMGGVEIPRSVYLKRLKAALALSCRFD